MGKKKKRQWLIPSTKQPMFYILVLPGRAIANTTIANASATAPAAATNAGNSSNQIT